MTDAQFLSGRLLLAMPGMGDPRFDRSVNVMCVHDEHGALGIGIGHLRPGVRFRDLLEDVGIDPGEAPDCPVHHGGPVEPGRGFVLHSSDFFIENSTLPIDRDISLTATLDILKAIANGAGPRRAILALGYAGWAPGQLENEIQHNGWLHCAADPDLVFGGDIDNKYERALRKLGIEPAMLSNEAGHA